MSIKNTESKNDPEPSFDAVECAVSQDQAVEDVPLEDAPLEHAKDEPKGTDTNVAKNSWIRRSLTCLWKVYIHNQFPFHILLAIALARAYPPLGAQYLAPDITSSWIAVIIIFFISGLGLKTEQFAKAFQQLYFNAYVQGFNFFFDSAIVFCFTRFLLAVNIIDRVLADGMVICSCLSMSINTVIVLSGAAGADEAAAVFNSAFGNFVGVFLSPVLILMYLGAQAGVDLGSVFLKLVLRVLVPLIVGQIVQMICKPVRVFFVAHKRIFKKVAETCLVFIVYTLFCQKFAKGSNRGGLGRVFLMILYEFLAMLFLMVVAWFSLRLLFKNDPEMRVMGLFGCTHKTIALGVPLISSMYQNNPNVALYTLPILIWHPMQLVFGSMLVPKLSAFIRKERERITAEKITPEAAVVVETANADDTVEKETQENDLATSKHDATTYDVESGSASDLSAEEGRPTAPER